MGGNSSENVESLAVVTSECLAIDVTHLVETLAVATEYSESYVDLNQIVEALAVATSECPVTDVVVVVVQSTAFNNSSVVVPSVTRSITITEAAESTSETVDDAYAVLVNAAQTSSDVFSSFVVTALLDSDASGYSTPIAVFNQIVGSTANAEDEAVPSRAPQLLLSAAQATSTFTINTNAELYVDETAKAASSVAPGLLETAIEEASAVSAVTLLRRIEEFIVSSAESTNTVVASGEPQAFLLLSLGDAVSSVMLQSSNQILLKSTAEVSSGVWYKDPGRVAWLMNTETTAVSWYDNFDFESIAQSPDKVLAVGPDGLYELTGATDSGERIDAEVVSGFTDFGASQIKRVDNMYFGYTSNGRISVTAETYESGHPPSTYYLEQRMANAPRNSRVTPGKGLWGRYWRMIIRNVDGADFEIHDASVDIAVSSRRV